MSHYNVLFLHVLSINFRPSLEEIRSWGKSFDKLMRSLSGRKAFREFLRCEYSEENILFWLACEELKKETNPEAIEEKARFIYEDYISILSPKEVGFISFGITAPGDPRWERTLVSRVSRLSYAPLSAVQCHGRDFKV